MQKKIVLFVLLSLMCVGCSGLRKHYIQPVSDSLTNYNVFNEEGQELIKKLNGNETLTIADSVLSVGRELPDLEFEMYDGEKLNLENYKGKKVVVEFMSVTCIPCYFEEKYEMQNIEKDNSDITFIKAFVSGSRDDTFTDSNGNETEHVDTIKYFYDSMGVSYVDKTILVETEELKDYAFNTLRIDETPTFVFFDEQGKICWVEDESNTSDEFQALLDKVYSGKKLYNDIAEECENAWDYLRTTDNVKEDLLNYQNDIASLKLKDENLLYNNIGKKLQLDTLADVKTGISVETYKTDEITMYTVVSFENEDVEKNIATINNFQKRHENMNYINMVKSKNVAISQYERLDTKLIGEYLDISNGVSAKIAGTITQDVFLQNNTTVFFIDENGICMGVYDSEITVEALSQVYNTFCNKQIYKIAS